MVRLSATRVDRRDEVAHGNAERGSRVGQAGAVEVDRRAVAVRDIGHGRGLRGGQHGAAGEVVGVLEHHGTDRRRATAVRLDEGALDIRQVEAALIGLEQPRHEAAQRR